jgi:flagellar basal-body rod protein FlgG
MSNGIYVAASASIAAEKNLATVSNNLANVNTAGFKKDKSVFAEYLTQYKNDVVNEKMEENGVLQDKHFVSVDDTFTDFSNGSLKKTGNPLDLAISGDAFFKVKFNNQIFLQRSGDFAVSSDGRIVAKDGADVLDVSGNVIVVDPQFAVHIDENGGVWQNKQKIADLKLVSCDDKRWLQKVDKTRFVIASKGKEIDASNFSIHQGFLEQSNVNAIAEMVEMIKLNRHFDTASKAIHSYQDMDNAAINKVGRIG